VQHQEIAGQVPDQPVGVVGVHDHFHDVTDRALHQLDQRPGRGSIDRLCEFGDDRPSGAGPSCAFPGAEEPAAAKTAIHLHAQLRQIAGGPSSDQPHLPLDVIVTIDRRRDDLPQLVDRQTGDQSLDPHLGSDARSSTGHRPVPRRAIVA